MPSDSRELISEAAAAVAIKKLGTSRSFGVYLENLPPLDAQRFVDDLGKGITSEKLRVAVLGTTANVKGSKNVEVTTSSTQANVWRNDSTARSGTPTVVLVVGPTSKLNSLRTTFLPVTHGDLRHAITEAAVALLDTPGRGFFWRALEAMPSEFPLQLLSLLAVSVTSAAAKSRATLMDQEWQLVRALHLIPQQALFEATGIRSATNSIRKNRAFVARLRKLSKRDRSQLLRVHDDKRSSESRKDAATAILHFEKGGDVKWLSSLDMELAKNVLQQAESNAEPQSQVEPPSLPKIDRLDGDALALELLIGDSRGVKVAAKRYAQAIDATDDSDDSSGEITVDRRLVVPRPKAGTAQATSLFGRLLSEESWGGMIDAIDAPDHVAALKLLASGHVDVLEFRPGSEQNLRWMLARAVNQGLADSRILETWDAFALARKKVLPSAGALIDHPLLALAGNDSLRESAAAVLEAYARLLDGIKDTAEKLRKAGSIEPAKRMFAFALCLDIAFVHSAAGWTAIAAPTHPFHLWRWLTLLEVIGSNREDLERLGLEVLEPLVTDPPPSAPDIVLSPFAVGPRLSRAIAFVPNGSFGALPQFGEPSARMSSKFRARSLANIAQRFVRLMPHASLGLRVLMVDPPSIAGAVEDLLSIRSSFDDDLVVPIHIIVARTRLQREGTDEEDADLEDVARDVREEGGTLDVLPLFAQLGSVASSLKKIQPHITVVFDPGESQELRVGILTPPKLSPLVVPRSYRYDPFDDRLDVVIAGDGAVFGSYHDLFCELLDLPTSDFVGRRSGASRYARDLEAIAAGTMWMVVVDQGVEATLRVDGAVRLDWRTEGGRDLLTYTAHQETVEQLVEDAVSAAGLVPTEETVKRTLRQILQFSGEALLALAKPRPDVSMADPRISKGMIGVLSAGRWYEKAHADSVLISLDEPASRLWILGSNDDNRHGDLLGIRLSATGVVVEAVEVKAHEDLEHVIRVSGGKIEGKAAVQVDQTIKVLKRILTPGKQTTIDRARSDILKDQLYRAVASRSYPSDQRGRFVHMLEDLFANGPEKLGGLIVRVRIESNQGESPAVVPKVATSPAGNEIGILDLLESEVGLQALRSKTPIRSMNAVKEPSKRAKSQDKPAPVPVEKNQDNVVLQENTLAIGLKSMDAGAGVTPPRSVRFLLGTTAAGEDVFWDPQRAGAALNNFGLLVTGDPGSGKTQILRALIDEVIQQGIPVCIFDFKNDYSEPSFVKPLGIKVFDIEADGLPFNPLSLVPDISGEVRPVSQIHTISSILRRIFHLGDQQESQLKKAMQTAYSAVGIDVGKRQNVAGLPASPSFADVVEILQEEGKTTLTLLNRLSPLFDLNLFPATDAARTSFEELISKPAVLDLHKLPEDRIKAAMAEFLIVRLHNYILRGDQPRELRRLLVFDEAWRVKESERLEELAREGRAFGVGIAIGTQFPGDIPERLSGNLASQLLLQNNEIEHRKSVARTLVGSSSGPAAAQIMTQTQHLKQHEGFFRNQQYSPYVLLTTLPYYARKTRGQDVK